jgi:diaminopimelate decarboxylase
MTQPLYLRPRVEGPLQDLLRQDTLLHTLVGALGSPLDIVIPDQLVHNLRDFREIYTRRSLAGEVYFAHKANRSPAFPRRLAAEVDPSPARIDVASLAELRTALGSGFEPAGVLVTGPKSPQLLWLAARTGATVQLDGLAELHELAGIVRRHGLRRVPVLLRLCGFTATGTTVMSRPSRFGIAVDDIGTAIDALLAHADAVDLLGVGFHLDTMGLPEKAVALESCLHAVTTCLKRGLTPSVVDIGGGFGINYLAHAEDWQTWTSQLTQAVLGRRPPLTWAGHGYGLRNDAGTLRGSLTLYPAHRPVAGPAYLDELLAVPAQGFGGQPLGTVIQEHLLDLWAEPGRALLDQCGAVLARVLEVRPRPDGNHAVRLDLNADDVSLEEHGVLLDPLLIQAPGSRRPDDTPEGPQGVYLLGNLCLETDLITHRVVHLPGLPRTGDLLAFPNTAGYFMDFNAHHAIGQPIARTVAVRQEHGRWQWCLDDGYWPVSVTGENSPEQDTAAGEDTPA